MLITVLVGSFLWMGATASIEQARLRAACRSWSRRPGRTRPWASRNGPPWPKCWRWPPDPATGASPAVVLYRPDGRPAAVVDAGAVATVPAAAAATTPLTAVSYALGAGAYVPEWSKGQELIQYLAQLDGLEYAVVDRDGTVTGLLRQAAVLGAITGKNAGSGKRMYGQSR